MTNAVTVAIIGGSVAVIVAFIERTHRAVNSRMTEMLNIVKQSSHAEGVVDEKTRSDAEKGSRML